MKIPKLIATITLKMLDLKMLKKQEPKCIIMHPETERNIFLKEELLKSESLEEHFKMPVILTKTVPVGEFLIGV